MGGWVWVARNGAKAPAGNAYCSRCPWQTSPRDEMSELNCDSRRNIPPLGCKNEYIDNMQRVSARGGEREYQQSIRVRDTHQGEVLEVGPVEEGVGDGHLHCHGGVGQHGHADLQLHPAACTLHAGVPGRGRSGCGVEGPCGWAHGCRVGGCRVWVCVLRRCSVRVCLAECAALATSPSTALPNNAGPAHAISSAGSKRFQQALVGNPQPPLAGWLASGGAKFLLARQMAHFKWELGFRVYPRAILNPNPTP